MAAKFTVEEGAIRQLADILIDTNLTEIEYEDNGRRIRVSRSGGVQTVVTAAAGFPAPEVAAVKLADISAENKLPAPADHPGTLKSPMVGTAYLSPEPGAPSFVKAGDMITQGQTLMIIEAMKVLNPIKAPRAGKLAAIIVRDANPVEFGEPLMIIE